MKKTYKKTALLIIAALMLAGCGDFDYSSSGAYDDAADAIVSSFEKGLNQALPVYTGNNTAIKKISDMLLSDSIDSDMKTTKLYETLCDIVASERFEFITDNAAYGVDKDLQYAIFFEGDVPNIYAWDDTNFYFVNPKDKYYICGDDMVKCGGITQEDFDDFMQLAKEGAEPVIEQMNYAWGFILGGKLNEPSGSLQVENENGKFECDSIDSLNTTYLAVYMEGKCIVDDSGPYSTQEWYKYKANDLNTISKIGHGIYAIGVTPSFTLNDLSEYKRLDSDVLDAYMKSLQ